MKQTVTRNQRRMTHGPIARPWRRYSHLGAAVYRGPAGLRGLLRLHRQQFQLHPGKRASGSSPPPRSVVQEDGTSAEVHTYLLIFWRSLKLAVISTVICLLLGYPMAYIMARAKARTQKIMMTLIMIPMWMNFLIRTYAWMTILQDTGHFQQLPRPCSHLPNVHIIGTEAAVVIGMVYDYIPYMILPLYSIMAKMDEKLIEAARDLGCNGLGVLRRVIWPLSLPGVISGVTMVLIPSVSTFYISQKAGRRQDHAHRRRD